jgi:hypothetical protein
MACHYCSTKYADVTDVQFVDLTARENRMRALRNLRNIVMVTFMAIAGFLFFPMMILWLTGEDVFANMADNLNDGGLWFTGFHLTLDLLMALVAGFIGIALFPRED